jgi:hypothetical protein
MGPSGLFYCLPACLPAWHDVAFGRPIGSRGVLCSPAAGLGCAFMLVQMTDAEWEQYRAQQSEAQRKR